MSADIQKDIAPIGTAERHVALLGGWRRAGGKPAPSSALAVAVVGGANLDYGTSAFPAGGTTVTLVAFVGGIDVTVPEGTKVEISGFNLFGRRRNEVQATGGDGPTLRVRAFSVWGGVHVHTA